MLDDLDKELKTRGHRFVRYADDFTILLNSQREKTGPVYPGLDELFRDIGVLPFDPGAGSLAKATSAYVLL